MISSFVKQFEESLGPSGFSWLKKTRRNAFDQFTTSGYPSPREEEWRYTSVKPISETSFERPTLESTKDFSLKQLSIHSLDTFRMVFVNGFFSPHLSSLEKLPEGVRCESLRDLFNQNPKVLEPYLSHLEMNESHPFVALNTAFLTDGAFVYLPKDCILNKPLELVYFTLPNGKPLVTHPRNLIIAESGAQGFLIEHYEGLPKKTYFTNAVTKIVSGENTVLHHYKLQNESKRAFHIASVAAEQANQSHLTSYSISLGAILNRTDIGTRLHQEGAEAVLNGLYVTDDSQHVDHHTSIDHAQPHCTSSELYKGVLGDTSQGVFNGKIIVRPDAEKTQARQINKNLLLSEEASINTKPLLEILNNDVKCNHGATIGRLDDNQIFYLRSRGISETHARSLLIYAFAGEVIDSIKIEPLRNQLQKILFDRWIHCPLAPELS